MISYLLKQRESLRGITTPTVNAGLEGFSRAAALELQSAKVRVNVIRPPWIRETLVALNMNPSSGMPADEVA